MSVKGTIKRQSNESQKTDANNFTTITTTINNRKNFLPKSSQCYQY